MNKNIKGLIELRLKNVDQLFNTMDTSPFHERDLDHDAEEFILSWAREHEKDSELRIKVILNQPSNELVANRVRESIHHYFETRAKMSKRELAELFREGRISLVIGLSFLAVTTTLVNYMPKDVGWADYLKGGMEICGWVGLWKPIDIHLYCWWPVRAHGALLSRLSMCPVDVVFEPQAG